MNGSFPSAEQILAVLTLQAGLNSAIVVVGTACLGVAAGIVGCFALLRKRALMGDALAHSTLPGVCLAFLVLTVFLNKERTLAALLAGAALTGVAGVYTVHLISRHTRLPEDAAIGAVLSVFFGAGVVLLSFIQSLSTGSEGGLHHFIYGQTAAMSLADARLIVVLALTAIVAAVMLFKEFRMLCFDYGFAQVQGWPVVRLDLAMMTLVVLITITGLQSVGIILVIALLIIPPAAARFWTERLTALLVLSAFIGGLSGYLGASLSALLPRMPAGAVIVLLAGLLFLFSFLFAPQRGVAAAVFRQLRVQMRVNTDHILRRLYEEFERRNVAVSADVLIRRTVLPRGFQAKAALLLLRWQGFLALDGGGQVGFTQPGLARAARLVRNHRLWEQYIHRFGQLAVTHVDYSADYVEHVLSAELVAQLERELGRTPEDSKSLHSLSAGDSA